MFDLLAIVFGAIKYSVMAIAKPSPNIRIRRFQYLTLVLSAVGITLMVWGVANGFRFNFGAGSFCLLIVGVGFCGAAGCTGMMIEKTNEKSTVDS